MLVHDGVVHLESNDIMAYLDTLPSKVAPFFPQSESERVFDPLDERLAASRWLIGERLSVLDIAWFITTVRVSKAGYPLERHPDLLRWHAELTGRPAFATETSDPLLLRVVLRVVLPFYAAYRRLTGSTLLDVAG